MDWPLPEALRCRARDASGKRCKNRRRLISGKLLCGLHLRLAAISDSQKPQATQATQATQAARATQATQAAAGPAGPAALAGFKRRSGTSERPLLGLKKAKQSEDSQAPRDGKKEASPCQSGSSFDDNL